MSDPIEMLLWCPSCNERHIDQGEFATRPHHTHACQKCGLVWRPAVINTVGVTFLPGFKDPEIAPVAAQQWHTCDASHELKQGPRSACSDCDIPF